MVIKCELQLFHKLLIQMQNVVLSVIDPSGNTTEYKMNISSNNYYYDYNINLIGSYKLVAKYNDVEIIERFNFHIIQNMIPLLHMIQLIYIT